MRAMRAAESNPRPCALLSLSLSLSPRSRSLGRSSSPSDTHKAAQTHLPSSLHRRGAAAYLVMLSNIYARPFAPREVPLHLHPLCIAHRGTTRARRDDRPDALPRRASSSSFLLFVFPLIFSFVFLRFCLFLVLLYPVRWANSFRESLQGVAPGG